MPLGSYGIARGAAKIISSCLFSLLLFSASRRQAPEILAGGRTGERLSVTVVWEGGR